MGKLTIAQQDFLLRLRAQAKAAEDYPGTYSRGLCPGTIGCHKGTANALIRMGLIIEVNKKYGLVDLPDAAKQERID